MLLTTIPVYCNPDISRRTLDTHRNVDCYIVDNSPEKLMNAELKDFSDLDNFTIFTPENNLNCNGGWNAGMKYFLENKQYEWLAIGSSDVTMCGDWEKFFKTKAKNKNVYKPSMLIDYTKLPDHTPVCDRNDCTKLLGSPAGEFSVLSREAVEIVYPIPESLKLWFGDEYMYKKLKLAGYDLMMINNMLAYHYLSTSVNHSKEARSTIEEDKIAWEKLNLF